MPPSTVTKIMLQTHPWLPCSLHARIPSSLLHHHSPSPLLSLRTFQPATRPLALAAAPSKARTTSTWLAGVDKEHHDDVLRVIEQATRAVDDWRVAVTDFYPPPVVYAAIAAVQQMADAAAVPWGGYAQAERCRYDSVHVV